MAVKKKLRNLGSFGTKTEGPEEAEFSYFGTTVRTNPTISTLDVVDFLEEASAMDDDDPRGVLVVKKFLRKLIHEKDFDTLWETARANGQDMSDLMDLARSVTEGIVKRPTGPQSDSSETRPKTDTSSEADSSSME